ncbi:hypothetical protein HU200_052066 [Digitaria exilis]|uniref:Uncharacterized protein n=1 Tax=Digitaria exilis TaxID=1010633 RepID=A0A835AQY1_9POAL|nr:hypothetical protein HU200_052066 [Digitaria exilis]
MNRPIPKLVLSPPNRERPGSRPSINQSRHHELIPALTFRIALAPRLNSSEPNGHAHACTPPTVTRSGSATSPRPPRRPPPPTPGATSHPARKLTHAAPPRQHFPLPSPPPPQTDRSLRRRPYPKAQRAGECIMGLPTETGGCAGTSSSSAPASRQQPCGGVGNGNKELAADAVGFRTPQRRVASGGEGVVAAAGGDDDELTIREEAEDAGVGARGRRAEADGVLRRGRPGGILRRALRLTGQRRRRIRIIGTATRTHKPPLAPYVAHGAAAIGRTTEPLPSLLLVFPFLPALLAIILPGCPCHRQSHTLPSISLFAASSSHPRRVNDGAAQVAVHVDSATGQRQAAARGDPRSCSDEARRGGQSRGLLF